MAKAQTKQAADASNQLINQSRQQQQQFQQQTQQQLQGAQNRQNETYSGAMSGLRQQQETGGFDADRLAGLRTRMDNIGLTGGFDPDQLRDLRSSLSTGNAGFDADQLAKIRASGNLFMDTGGYDMEQLGKVRTGYEDFANTGGFTDQAKTNFLNRGASGLAQTYGALTDRLKRTAAASGHNVGGEAAKMARQLGQDQATSTLEANTTLNDMVNKNRLAGLGGLAGVESDFAKGRTGAAAQMGQFESGVASGNRDMLKTRSDLEQGVAGGIRQGVGMGADLEGRVATGRNSANDAMVRMFQTSTGEVSDLGKRILDSMGLDYSTQEAAIRSLTELSKNPGLFQTIFNDVIAGAGAVAGLGSAFGGGGKKGNG